MVDNQAPSFDYAQAAGHRSTARLHGCCKSHYEVGLGSTRPARSTGVIGASRSDIARTPTVLTHDQGVGSGLWANLPRWLPGPRACGLAVHRKRRTNSRKVRSRAPALSPLAAPIRMPEDRPWQCGPVRAGVPTLAGFLLRPDHTTVAY